MDSFKITTIDKDGVEHHVGTVEGEYDNILGSAVKLAYDHRYTKEGETNKVTVERIPM